MAVFVIFCHDDENKYLYVVVIVVKDPRLLFVDFSIISIINLRSRVSKSGEVNVYRCICDGSIVFSYLHDSW